jgi:regulator of nucleoside diphosphate kinase
MQAQGQQLHELPKPKTERNIMNETPIHLTREDHARLRLLVTTVLHTATNSTLAKLRDELDRAFVLESNAQREGLVTLDSRVEFEDLSTGEIEDYTITFPDRANVDEKRLSILAPIGTALIGYREGDVVSWETPGGVRRLKIRQVTQPAATPADLVSSASPSWAAGRQPEVAQN